MTKVLFLTTAHHHDDDRIFHHQAKSLRDAGYHVKVTSLSSTFSGILDCIEIEAIDALHKSIREKAAIMSDVCEQFAYLQQSATKGNVPSQLCTMLLNGTPHCA